jgi:hypothetical protein
MPTKYLSIALFTLVTVTFSAHGGIIMPGVGEQGSPPPPVSMFGTVSVRRQDVTLPTRVKETPATDASPDALLPQLRNKFPNRSDAEIIRVLHSYACPDQLGNDQGMAWFKNRLQCARKQWRAAGAIERFGGGVSREYKREASNKSQVSAPAWLRGLLGDDFFASIVEVTIASDAGMEHLKGLPQLKHLRVGITEVQNWGPGFEHAPQRSPSIPKGKVTDAGLRSLHGLTQIESLDFEREHVAITDAGLVHLESLPNLRRLKFLMAAITDKGLGRLAEKLPRLEFVEMHGTKTTMDGVKRLQMALPKCQVIWSEGCGILNERAR